MKRSPGPKISLGGTVFFVTIAGADFFFFWGGGGGGPTLIRRPH